jgi:CheY-like chemotaxis protein
LLLEQFFGPLTQKQEEYVREISTSGEHLLALINDILDLSKIEAGSMELEFEAVDFEAMLKSCVSLVKEKAHKNGLDLQLTEIAEEMQSENGQRLYADPRKLKQVIVNLLSNAVKFTPSGGKVSLSGEFWPPINAGEEAFVAIRVRDSGIGISADDQKKLFQSFSQVDGSLSRRHEGTGLGLALSKRLIELHGGNIEVESTLGHGSVFSVVVPMNRQLDGKRIESTLLDGQYSVKDGQVIENDIPQVAFSAPKPPSQPVVQEASRPAPKPTIQPVMYEQQHLDAKSAIGQAEMALGNLKTTVSGSPLILVVEDDDRAAQMIETYLHSAGYRTARAENGQVALEQVALLHPDGITLDLMMPVMDGWAFLERLGQMPEAARIPVVVLTFANNLEEGLVLGATAVLSKPVRRELLLSVLEKALGRDNKGARILVVDDDPSAV